MSQDFITTLLNGDVRSIVITVLALFCIYWLVRFIRELPLPMRELVYWMRMAAIGLLIYGALTNPARVGEIFFMVVDWTTDTITAFLQSDTSGNTLEGAERANSRLEQFRPR